MTGHEHDPCELARLTDRVEFAQELMAQLGLPTPWLPANRMLRPDRHFATAMLGKSIVAARLLADERLLDVDVVALVAIAATCTSGAHDGQLADRAELARAAMDTSPADFDDVDFTIVATAIEGLRRDGDGFAAPRRAATRLGTGLRMQAFADLSRADAATVIVADASRWHLVEPDALHLHLAMQLDAHRDELGLPLGSDPAAAPVDSETAVRWLGEIATACAKHRWVLAASERIHGPHGAATANGDAALDAIGWFKSGDRTWAELIAYALELPDRD